VVVGRVAAPKLSPAFEGEFQQPLAGVELPGHEAVYRLATKGGAIVVAQGNDSACKLSQLR